jgi:hypothetical protein
MTLPSIAMYSISDLRSGGQLDAMSISLALDLRKDRAVSLYPIVTFPDFITSFNRLFILSCCFFYQGKVTVTIGTAKKERKNRADEQTIK